MLTEENLAIARVPETGSGGTRSAMTRAKYLFDRGEFAETIAIADRILARDAEHLGAWEVRVRAEWRLGDFPAVLRSLRKLTLLNPYEPGYFLMQGDALRMLGQNADARAAYGRCLPFERTTARFEALMNIEEIDGLLLPSESTAPIAVDGISEFLPPAKDSLDAWVPMDRVAVEEGPTWAAAARPS
jgi:tetratricopeptide (TPR) repeat protein